MAPVHLDFQAHAHKLLARNGSIDMCEDQHLGQGLTGSGMSFPSSRLAFLAPLVTGLPATKRVHSSRLRLTAFLDELASALQAAAAVAHLAATRRPWFIGMQVAEQDKAAYLSELQDLVGLL